MKALKRTLQLLLFVALIAAPVAGRWFWYTRGSYQAPEIPTVQPPSQVAATAEYKSYVDAPAQHPGRIVIDRVHDNNLQVDDLTPLLNRLGVRGASVKDYDFSSESLAAELRGATAFLVLAPTASFDAVEILAVEDFVKSGGLLFLVADPTRSVPAYSEYGYVDLYSLFFPESAVVPMNSLANHFGISYYEDYLYNLKDYDTNYRNIKITQFAPGSLTDGLKQVTLFAAHSLKSDGKALLLGDSDTLSNVRTGETGLSAAALSADGRVLALGDLNLLLAPYHRAADNDRLLSNIADWLVASQRDWQLKDFPYLFQHATDVVQIPPTAEDNVLEAGALDIVSPLQQVFLLTGQKLEFRQQPAGGHDVIYLGTYQNLAPVQSILDSAGISVTLVKEVEPSDDQKDAKPTQAAGATPTAAPKSTLTIQGVGVFNITGAQLFLVDKTTSQTRLVILGEDQSSLAAAMNRLVFADFMGCVTQGGITLCSTTPTSSGGGGGEATPTPAQGEVFLLAVDGKGAGRSSAPEWEAALGDYKVTVWYTSQAGMPTAEDMAGYQVLIIDTSDFAYDSTMMADLPAFDGGFLWIGEQPSDPSYYDQGTAPLLDLKLVDSSHPLAKGFEPDQVIALAESVSGAPAVVQPGYETSEGIAVVFARGPASDSAGAPVVAVIENPDVELRYVFATFAFYRLPVELQSTFALNVVNWLLGK